MSFWGALSRPVGGAWLAVLRILFGTIMAVSMGRFLAYGWVHRFFIAPRFHFKYWGFSFVEPLAPAAMVGLFWALLGLSVCMALGLCFRLSAGLFAIGLLYVQLLDVATYLNHYYLAVLISFLLAASPAGRVWSLDASLLAARSGRGWFASPLRELPQVPAFWLYLFRFQAGIVYFFAGFAKLNSDWLLHAQPLRIWLGARTELPLLGPLLTIEGVPLAMSWAGFLFDLTIPLWLSLGKTRLIAYGVLLVFHGMTRLLFPIGMFPVIMSVLALVFFPPDWPVRCVHLLRCAGQAIRGKRACSGLRGVSTPAASGSAPSPGRFLPGPGVMTVRFFALYCLVQVILPLRFAFYGGNVAWHEQGMRFSWRVMLRAKGGSVDYLARDRGTGEEFRVPPHRYLTKFQESELSSQPDLIVQLAHHVARDFERRGRDVAVFATAYSNLNGRRPAPLVDPTLDLTQVEDGLGPAGYILPAPTAVPPKTRPVL